MISVDTISDTLDQMTIAVEAGLGFEAARIRAANSGEGLFAEELTRTLNTCNSVSRAARPTSLLSRGVNILQFGSANVFLKPGSTHRLEPSAMRKTIL